MNDVPKLYDQLCQFYDELAERANDGGLFTGRKMDALQATGIPMGSYGKLNRMLTDLGCVVVIQRGTSGTDSIVQLVKPPNLEEFRAAQQLRRSFLPSQKLTKRVELATLQDRVSELERRTAELDLIVKGLIAKGEDDNGTTS